MNESGQFEEIPEDVKQEMLMLFETYSKNELINKLRSLRKPSFKTPEKITVLSGAVANTTASQSQLSGKVEIKSNETLADTNNLNENNIVSSQNSARSQILETSKPLRSEDLDLPQQNIGDNVTSTNKRKIRNRRSKHVNNSKKNIQNESSDNVSNDSTTDKQPPDKVNSVSPKTNVRLKSRQQCKAKKNKQCESEQEVIPSFNLNNAEADNRSLINVTYSSSKKLNHKNKLSKINDTAAEIIKNNNVPTIEPATADSYINDVFDNNEIISLKSFDLSPAKKTAVKLVDANEITNCDVNVPPIGLSIANSNVVCDRNKNNSVKSSDLSPAMKNLKLLKANEMINCDVSMSSTSNNSANVTYKNKKANEITEFCNAHASPVSNVPVLGLQDVEKFTMESLQTNNSMPDCDENNLVIVKEESKNTGAKPKYAKKKLQNNKVKLASNADIDVQPLPTISNNSDKVEKYLQSKISSNDNIETSKPVDSENTQTSPELNCNNQNLVKKSIPKKRSNRILSNTESKSNVNLKAKTRKKKTPKCSDIDTLPSTFNVEENLLVSKVSSNEKSDVISTEWNSDDGISNTRYGFPVNDEVLSNSESIFDLEQINLDEKECNSFTSHEEEHKNEKKTCESDQPAQNTDAILTSKSKEKIKGKKIKSSENTSDDMQQNAEAYSKLSKLCSLHGLNIDDIFRRKEVKEMIENYKNNTDAIVFIGTHKCHSTKKIEPVIHVHKSKEVLLETLTAIQNEDNDTSNI